MRSSGQSVTVSEIIIDLDDKSPRFVRDAMSPYSEFLRPGLVHRLAEPIELKPEEALWARPGENGLEIWLVSTGQIDQGTVVPLEAIRRVELKD